MINKQHLLEYLVEENGHFPMNTNGSADFVNSLHAYIEEHSDRLYTYPYKRIEMNSVYVNIRYDIHKINEKVVIYDALVGVIRADIPQFINILIKAEKDAKQLERSIIIRK